MITCMILFSHEMVVFGITVKAIFNGQSDERTPDGNDVSHPHDYVICMWDRRK